MITIVDRAPSPTTDRTRWLEYRQSGIGGSDVAGILGVSDWATPWSVWADKTNPINDTEPSEAAQLGNDLEPFMIEQFTRRTGLHVIGTQTPIHDPKHPWRHATLDGLAVPGPDNTIDDAVSVVEIKTTIDDSWADGLPAHYEAQLEWQLGISGLTTALIPTFHMGRGRHIAIYRHEANPALYKRIAKAVDEFWHGHVITGTPPPADGHDATTRAIRRHYRTDDGTTIELDPVAHQAAVELATARATAAEAAARVERIENMIRAAIGPATVATLDGVPMFSLKTQSTGARIDTDRLRAEHPEIAQACTKPAGTTRVLRTL